MCQGQCLRPQRCLYRILCEQLSQDIPAGYKTKMKGPPHAQGPFMCCGSERYRSADLTIFSRTLYQLSYRALRIYL